MKRQLFFVKGTFAIAMRVLLFFLLLSLLSRQASQAQTAQPSLTRAASSTERAASMPAQASPTAAHQEAGVKAVPLTARKNKPERVEDVQDYQETESGRAESPAAARSARGRSARGPREHRGGHSAGGGPGRSGAAHGRGH